ncbi:MAG: hypothetical protein ACD_79C00914G0001 [uncultured bacterium]|nr:MAG: hypothetical protein ACD_79C00914G0001 [uncultured bacterium]
MYVPPTPAESNVEPDSIFVRNFNEFKLGFMLKVFVSANPFATIRGDPAGLKISLLLIDS